MVVKTYNGFTIRGKLQHDCSSYNEILSDLCNQANIKYLGLRITKERQCITIVNYRGNLYYTNCITSNHMHEYTINFSCFLQRFEDTEAYEEYSYSLEYCNPNIDKNVILSWFFKESEQQKALDLLNLLGNSFATLSKTE